MSTTTATKNIAKFKRGKVPDRIVLPGGTGIKMNDRITKVMKKRAVAKPSIPTTFRVSGFDALAHPKVEYDPSSAMNLGPGMLPMGAAENGHMMALHDRLGYPNQPNYRFEPYQQHFWRPPRGRYWRGGFYDQQLGGWDNYAPQYNDPRAGGWNRPDGGDYYGGYAYRYRNRSHRGRGGGGGGRRHNPQYHGGGGNRGVTKDALDRDLDDYWKHSSKSGSASATTFT